MGSLGSIACLTISGASEWTKVKIEIEDGEWTFECGF